MTSPTPPHKLAEMRDHVRALKPAQRAAFLIDLCDLVDGADDVIAIAEALAARGRFVMRVVYAHEKEIRGPKQGTVPNPTVAELGRIVECPPAVQAEWAVLRSQRRNPKDVDEDAATAFLRARVTEPDAKPGSEVKLRLRAQRDRINYVAIADLILGTYQLVRILDGRDQ